MTWPDVICCGLRGWAKTIAWIQIVLSATGLLGLVIFFMKLLLGDNKDDSNWSKNEYVGYFRSFNAALLLILAFLVFFLGCTVFGRTLLRGVNNNQVSDLKWWIRVMAIFLFTNCSPLLTNSKGENLTIRFVIVLMTCLPCGVAMYIVWCLLVRIREDGKEMGTPGQEGQELDEVVSHN